MRRFALGLDLGRSQDPTALAVVEARPEHWLSGTPKPTRLEVSHLDRFPLGTSYTEVVDVVVQLAQRLYFLDPDIVVDASGLGRPIVDQLRARGLPKIVAAVFTGGTGAGSRQCRGKRGAEDWTVSKIALFKSLAATVYSGRLRVAASLPHTAALLGELADLEVRTSSLGLDRFAVADEADHHADLATAAALAVWRLEQPKPFRVRQLRGLPGRTQ